MANPGVHVYEQATAVSTPVVADVGIPFVVGRAPAHAASNPAKANIPVLATSWDEAVEKLGFSYDWKAYSLCEFMYSHFQLFGCQPVIFCNVLDADTMKKTVAAKAYSVADHRISLPFGAIHNSISVSADDGTFEIVSAVNAAVLGQVGQKDGLTGCTLAFNEGAKTLTMTLTGPVSGVKNTGIFDTLAGLIEAGYKVTIKGMTITGLTDFKETTAYSQLIAMEQGAEDVTFVAMVSSGESPEAPYKIVVSYPAAEAAQDESGTAEDAAPVTTSMLQEDVDYTILYDSDSDECAIELLSSGSAYNITSLVVAYDEVSPDDVSTADVVMGLSEVDACMNRVGVIPDLICAPGYSHISTVAAIMATKAAGVNGLFRAKALIDCDSSETGVRQYSDLVAYKSKNNLVDENQILCWPMVKLGDYQFHMSTQLAGLMAQVDTANGGCPYESPSNKNFQMDSCCLEDGEEVNLTFEQANMISSYGIVTALNFMSSGWTCRNNYTACYPGNTDVKDYFIPVSRMFDWVANTLIRTFWNKLDKPMNRRLIDTILDTCNIWLGGLVGSEYLLGARAELLDSENPLTDLMAGIIRIHIYMTPPSPAQEIDFTLEYDVSYVSAALAA